ncbi:MAG: toll/interleukin-1 receptor domain-containing protein [Gammaproteobacteria bacterium]
MIVDLDRWLADEQERVAEERVFPHDMFISHRRFDLPADLVDSLSARGANIVWDCDLDLRDRRVMQGVAHAMRRSRFVALYVSERYVDSPWCRAEYLNALGWKKSSISQEHLSFANLKLPCPASPKVFTQCASLS